MLFTNNKNGKDGFVALFTVILLGFFAVIAMLITAPQAWLQVELLSEDRDKIQAQLNVFSCLNIARSQIYQKMEGGDESFSEIIRDYPIITETCRVESVIRSGNAFEIVASSRKNKARVSLRAVFSFDGYVFGSIRRVDN